MLSRCSSRPAKGICYSAVYAQASPTSAVMCAAASLASAAGARASQLTQSMRSLWGRTMSAPTQQPAQKHQLKVDMLRPQSAVVRQKSQTSSSRPASAGPQQVTHRHNHYWLSV